MRYFFKFAGVVILALAMFVPSDAQERDGPNIILIVSDDAGFADFSFQHGSTVIKPDITTPNLDSIAEFGTRFTSAYVTCWVCSPSRAGMLTGRYQQRFGHEFNVPERPNEHGLPTDQTTLADMLQDEYETIALGKWHLGYVADDFHPLQRGFDHFFGFLSGKRDYLPQVGSDKRERIHRDYDLIDEEFEYLTDELAEQAAAFIDNYHDQPFFVYLAFNAVHFPRHYKQKDYDEFPNLPHQRRQQAAMTKAMDDGVGVVLEALDDNDLRDNTLIIFINDNGGDDVVMAADNSPLNGGKLSPYEGGIRVPCVMSWPNGNLDAEVFTKPVSSLDIVPTVLAAAGIDQPDNLDGVNLLPYLRGDDNGTPHETLYWRCGRPYAIRDGDWKLLKQRIGREQLFNLADDPGEQNDLFRTNRQKVRELRSKYNDWDADNVDPLWSGTGG